MKEKRAPLAKKEGETKNRMGLLSREAQPIVEPFHPSRMFLLFALALNLLILPGMGTALCGAYKRGALQGLLFIASLPLVISLSLGWVAPLLVWLWAGSSVIQILFLH